MEEGKVEAHAERWKRGRKGEEEEPVCLLITPTTGIAYSAGDEAMKGLVWGLGQLTLSAISLAPSLLYSHLPLPCKLKRKNTRDKGLGE